MTTSISLFIRTAIVTLFYIATFSVQAEDAMPKDIRADA